MKGHETLEDSDPFNTASRHVCCNANLKSQVILSEWKVQKETSTIGISHIGVCSVEHYRSPSIVCLVLKL